MKKVNLLFFSALIFGAAFLFSCQKHIEKTIEGSWIKESGLIYSTVDEDSAIWHFNDGTLVIDNITTPQYSDQGTYKVVIMKGRYILKIEGLKYYVGESTLNGNWRIINYRNDLLTISKPDQALDEFSLSNGQEIGNIIREFSRMQ
ncbi:MAG: hypothetical protein MH137_08015 [Flavobacteriales bacterium]|nr:hypothetical protein [Flavobacteriales bacterium]